MRNILAICLILIVAPKLHAQPSIQGAKLTSELLQDALVETYTVKGQVYLVKNKLVDADEFRSGLQLDDSMLVTLPLTDRKAIGPIANSYVFLVSRPPNADQFGLEINQFTGNYRILLIEKDSLRQTLVAELGRLSTDPEQSRLTSKRNIFRAFPESAPTGTEYYLVVQRSTTSFMRSIFPASLNHLAIGNYQERVTLQRSKVTEAALIAGMLLMLAISNFFLFLQRPEDKASPFIGLFAIIYAVRHMTTEGLWAELIVEHPNFLQWCGAIIVYTATTTSILCFAQFLRQTFKLYFPFRFLMALWVWNAIACVTITMVNASTFWVPVFFPLLLVSLGYIVRGLVRAIRAKSQGALQASIGVLLLIGGYINDALVATNTIEGPYISYYTAVIFVFIQSSIVGQNFATAFRTAERLSRHLAKEVERQTRNIKTILRHIHQGIFTVSGEARLVGDDHSAYLDDLLEETGYEGRSIDEILLERTNLSNDEKSRLRSVLDFSLDESELNFEINQASFIDEFEYKTPGGQTKLLKAEWSPVILADEDRVEKILVTLRDVTKLKQLEAQAAEHKETMAIISEVIEINPDRFTNFVKICKTFLCENERLIDQCNEADQEVLKILFINMHTMKGAARTYHLKKLTDVMHDAEQFYAVLQKGQDRWDKSRLRSDLAAVQEVFAVYEDVWCNKLGRDVSGQQVEIGVDTLRKSIEVLQELDSEIQAHPNLSPVFDDLRKTYFNLYYRNGQVVFDQIFEELPRLARDLDKEVPETIYDLTNIGFTLDGIEMIQNIFVHLLRNSMDHGIETKQVRLDKGKPANGRIQLEMLTDEQGRYLLVYQDDGRGLNIERIRSLGIERGLLSDGQKASLVDVASLIFESGFSTSKVVSDISGRGVGMGAVKQFLEESGGSIAIIPNGEPEGGFVSFKTVIQMSPNYCHLFAADEIRLLKQIA